MPYNVKICIILKKRLKTTFLFNNHETDKLLYVVYYPIRLTGIEFQSAT